MGRLTEEAREKYGFWMRLRFRLASACVGFGFRIMPREYWDHIQREELIRMCERYDVEPRDMVSTEMD